MKYNINYTFQQNNFIKSSLKNGGAVTTNDIIHECSFNQSIKRYSINSIKILIYNFSNTKEIKDLIVSSFSIVDNKNELLYPHLVNMNIFRQIDFFNTATDNNTECNQSIQTKIREINDEKLKLDSYDLLIINNLDEKETKELIKKNKNLISTYILIKNNCKTFNLKYNDWNIENNKNHTLLTYFPSSYSINFHETIHNYYELLLFINNNLKDEKIDFFLIKSSCLGCVRNRNHIIFCDKINICIDIENKTKLTNLEEKFNKNNITFEKNDNYYILKLTKVAKAKVYFYSLKPDKSQPDKSIYYIKDNVKYNMSSDEVGNKKDYIYGPIIVKSLENPNKYLKRLYGDNVFETLKHNSLSIKNPKFLYDCYYNHWSCYTSDYWKEKNIENAYKISKVLNDNGVKCWLCSGALLGAARDNFIPLFDDDIDLGVFDRDKANYLVHNNKISMHTSIEYVNSGVSFKFNSIPNLNYVFAKNNYLYVDFERHVARTGYASGDVLWFVDMGWLKGKSEDYEFKREFLDKLDKIKLGKYIFNCPSNHVDLLENKVLYRKAYGEGSICGNPIQKKCINISNWHLPFCNRCDGPNCY